MVENGPFGTPFFDSKVPPKKVCVGPFLRPFPRNEAHPLVCGGPKWGVLGGGQKLYVEKVYVLFLCSIFGPYPQYGWDFQEEIPERLRIDPGNALRAFPGIPVESTAGMPQTL